MSSSATVPKATQGEANIWVVLVLILVVLVSVWFVVKLGDNPSERANLPEEAVLAGFVPAPAGGAWLGMNIVPASQLAPPGNQRVSGVVVNGVIANSPAYRAGLQTGDIVETIDGTPVSTDVDVINALSSKTPGSRISLVVRRNGRRQRIAVPLAQQPLGRLAAAQQNVEQPWIGADVQPIDPLMMRQLGLPDTQGVIVSYVYPGSPAEAAGLLQGDVIQRIGETPVRSVDQLGGLVAAKPIGGLLRLVVWQGGTRKDVKLTIGTRPPPQKEFQPTLPEAIVEIEAAWLGLDIVPLTPAEAEELGLPQGLSGMVVDAVAAGAGVDAGFLVGDVIVAINGKKTSTVKSFKEATEGAVGAVVDVVRFGRHIYISVPPPGGVGGGGQTGVKQVGFRLW